MGSRGALRNAKQNVKIFAPKYLTDIKKKLAP